MMYNKADDNNKGAMGNEKSSKKRENRGYIKYSDG